MSDESVDRRVLLDLYNATDGPNWLDNTNWDTDEDLQFWSGVTTTFEGRVVNLRLPQNRLRGPLPRSLGQLGKLVDLQLGNNELRGAIPSDLGSLTALRELKLGGNHFSGPIPRGLGNLTSLEFLRLSHNGLSGTVPEELGNLVQLWVLDLNNNQLTGPLPRSLTHLRNLEHFRIDENAGLCIPPDPEFGVWLVTVLGDGFSGPTCMWVPKTATDVQAIVDREIAAQGGLHAAGEAVGLLVRLLFDFGSPDRAAGTAPGASRSATATSTYMATSSRPDYVMATVVDGILKLSPSAEIPMGGGTATITVTVTLEGHAPVAVEFTVTVEPATAGNGERLALIALYNATAGPNWTDNTNWLSEEPLSRWYGVATNGAGRVTHLRLQNNALVGRIPRNVASLEFATHLWFNDNDLAGPIPAELGRLSNLGHFSVDTNRRLTGPVPASFGNLRSLWTLRLEETALAGALPGELTNLRNLRHLSMHDSSLCVPNNREFRMWVDALRFFSGRYCGTVSALGPVGLFLLGILMVLAGMRRRAFR